MMSPLAKRHRMSRRAAAHDAALRKAYLGTAATVGAVPRKPFLTNGQVRRFVRRELRQGVPA